MEIVQCQQCGFTFYDRIFRTKRGYKYEKPCPSCNSLIKFQKVE